MHENKVLVICPLHQTVLQKYAGQIDYKPHLAEGTLVEWQEAIGQIKPKIIIINTEFFTLAMMQIWRDCLPTENLSVIRGGTSLSRCDLYAARHYSIRILNTPGINSKYVADYINQILFREHSSSDRIAVIGVGNIGSHVATAAFNRHANFVLYNKTKQSNRLHTLGIKNLFASNLEEAITQANKIAISLPLDDSTQGIITAEIIRKIPIKAILISVSPLEIFTEDALKALYDRSDMNIVFDDINSELQRVYKIIGSPHPLRSNFILETKAAASVECQNAMTSAAIEKGMSLHLTKNLLND